MKKSYSKETSINVDADVPKESFTNASAARKFVSPDVGAVRIKGKSNASIFVDDMGDYVSANQAFNELIARSQKELADTRESLANQTASQEEKTQEQIEAERARKAKELEDKLSQSSATGNASSTSNDVSSVAASIFGQQTTSQTSVIHNGNIPIVDYITLDMQKNKGTIDCFFVKIKFSIKKSFVDSGEIRAIKIRRALDKDAKFTRPIQPISLRGMEKLSTLRSRTRTKTHDQLGSMQLRMQESGIQTEINGISLLTGVRLTNSFYEVSNLYSNDRSVAENENAQRNIEANRTRSQQQQQQQKSDFKRTIDDFEANNDVKSTVTNTEDGSFKQICLFSLDKLKQKKIGDYYEYEIIDDTISYGKAYYYEVFTIDNNMLESLRTKLVNIKVEGIRVPERPKNVVTSTDGKTVTLQITVDDQLVEKFEVHRKTSRNDDKTFRMISTFINSSKESGGMFSDRDVTPGVRYTYRIYSVDLFGNKSESAAESSVYVADRTTKFLDLLTPTISAEVDKNTKGMKLSFECRDERVVSLFIARKDLTLGNKAFTAPSDVNFLKFGQANHAEGQKRFEGLKYTEGINGGSWTGYFNNKFVDMSFVDTTVHLDRTYKYSIYGVDKFGNKTSSAFSDYVMVLNRRLINSPANLQAACLTERESDLSNKKVVTGIQLKWEETNLDKSAEDMQSSQDQKSATQVKTMYQVERKKKGEEKWMLFPMITEAQYFDTTYREKVSDLPYRPEFLNLNEEYTYRVKAVQSGVFYSNYSNNVSIYCGLGILEPEDFTLKCSDIYARPLYVALNWYTSENSITTDRWEIQRAEVNNFAASQINVRDIAKFSQLNFQKFREVFRNSSRFSSQSVDTVNMNATLNAAQQNTVIDNKNSNFYGQHYFQDTSVSMGNTYYYRIRSVGLDESVSKWVYRAMKLTSPETERFLSSTLSDADRLDLTKNKQSVTIREDRRKTSFSLQPQFSKPK